MGPAPDTLVLISKTAGILSVRALLLFAAACPVSSPPAIHPDAALVIPAAVTLPPAPRPVEVPPPKQLSLPRI